MYIFKDRHGRCWITAEGLLRYFGIHVTALRKYFHDYEFYARCYS